MVVTTGVLSVHEVARKLGRSVEQVRRYIREGKLPAQKLGMQWFVNPDDLKAFGFQRSEHSAEESADPIAQVRANRDRIEARVGLIGAISLLDESRRSHF